MARLVADEDEEEADIPPALPSEADQLVQSPLLRRLLDVR